MMLSDTSSSSSDSDYDSSSTLDLADQINILLNDGLNDGPGPEIPPIVIDPRMLSRRIGRLEGIIKSPPRKTKNQLLKNQVLAAKNQMMAKSMQPPNKYGRKSTTDDNILTFNAADKQRVLNILPKDDVKACYTPIKEVSAIIDNYARRTLNIPPKDKVWAAASNRKVSVPVEDNRRSVKPVRRSAIQR